ncbi:MAG: DUF2007-related protein [Microbacter sp.]
MKTTKPMDTANNDEENDDPIEIFSGDLWECGMVKSLLLDAGIEAYLNNENLGTVAPWISAPGGAGAVSVIVAKHDYKAAIQIVRDFSDNIKNG